MFSPLNSQDCFGFDHGLPVMWFTPAQLTGFGIKQNSIPGQCFGKMAPGLLGSSLPNPMIGWLEGLLDVLYCMLLRNNISATLCCIHKAVSSVVSQAIYYHHFFIQYNLVRFQQL